MKKNCCDLYGRSLVQNSVVGVGAKVGEKCKLMDCQIADGYDVPDGTVAKNESFSDSTQAIQGDWWYSKVC